MKVISRTIFILFAILAEASIAFGQAEEAYDAVLDAPDGWGLEVLEFPLGFAREIDYQGIEEIWFAPGWKDTESEAFWAYSFVWYLEADAAMTSDKLKSQMQFYFNGIQGVSNSNAVFIELNDGSYVGSIETFDNFTTKEEFVLNIKMKPGYCEKTGKHTYLFHIAPAPFHGQIWANLERVQLADCN